MSDNTYGSFGVRIGRLRDTEGKYIKEDTLFLHLYIIGRTFMTQMSDFFGGARA